MTKPKTLREWMSDQQAPPEIQEKMQQLFHKVELWRWAAGTGKGTVTSGEILAQQAGWRQCADELEDILGKENT
jgi:hypothetical protein